MISEMELDWNTIVFQPTSLCNLNCDYCYLTERNVKSYLKQEIVDNIAKLLTIKEKKCLILWHGGEPLATGLKRFELYVKPFRGLVESGLCRHSIQTNATLINEEWCTFFKENKFKIGVSIDGTESMNRSRKFWNGMNSHEYALKGIEYLKSNNIPFGIISVVNTANIDRPEEFYEYLSSLGSYTLSINVEELEGLNKDKEPINKEKVQVFWNRLFLAWKRNPIVSLRHFRDALNVMLRISDEEFSNINRKSLYPTIDTVGNVYLLSPEFTAVPVDERDKFIIGNVLKEDLFSIIEKGRNSWYVNDFLIGAGRCKQYCSYFSFCRGGQASNKYFENNDIKSMETNYCFNSRKAPVNAILNNLSQ